MNQTKFKILFVTHLNPYSISFGAEQRTNILLNALDQLNCDIDIVYIGQNQLQYPSNSSSPQIYDLSNLNKQIDRLSVLKRLCLINMFPKSHELANKIQNIVEDNKYDYIVCRYLPYAAKCGLLKYTDRLLLDIDDMPEQALQIDFSQKKGIKNIYFKLLRKAYKRDTNTWIRNCKKCYVPNLSQAKEYGIGYLPNISSIWSTIDKQAPSNLLFIGKLDWKPNYDGIMYFLENCWIELQKRRPLTKLFIAGKGIDEKKARGLEEKYKGVKFLGYIHDIKEFYKLGSVVICPIYSGAGTNIKIVEALSMSKTLVASNESIKGYEHFLKDNENCLIAENDQRFVDKIVKVLNNSNYSSKLAINGFNDVAEIYSKEYIMSVISRDLQK